MNLTVCDFCYHRDGTIKSAVEIIPALTLPLSKRKIPERAACEDCIHTVVPIWEEDATRQKGHSRKMKAEKKEDIAPAVVSLLSKGEFARRDSVWTLALKYARKHNLAIANVHKEWRDHVRSKHMRFADKTVERAEKRAWLIGKVA